MAKFLSLIVGFGLAAGAASAVGAGESDEKEAAPDPKKVRAAWAPFVTPLSEEALKNDADPAVIDLGRWLFFEKRLSAEKSVSCNDCHDLSQYGANGAAVLEKREEKELRRDVPGLYNIASLIHYRWDGSLNTLKSQTEAALTDPNEMGMAGEDEVVERIGSIAEYRGRFKKAFPKEKAPVTFENIVSALETYQRGLVTMAPIDRFLLGDDDALTDDQLRGAVLFDRLECGACHTGTAFGGQMLQKVGIMAPWPNQEDLGYFEITKKSDHKMVFKVPSLRNVEKTAPYFHDYSARSLRRAIKTMAFYERGQDLGLDEILLLEEFLKSLTGELPVDYIKEPGKADVSNGS